MKKRLRTILCALFVCAMSMLFVVPAFAKSYEGTMPRLVDDAEVLTDEQKERILSQLDEISERQEFDVVIVTENFLVGKTPKEFADDFYDDQCYGFGENKDGVLLLVSVKKRDWHMSTSGYGIHAMTDAGVNYISKKFQPQLSDGNYEEAFSTFAEQCDRFVTQAKEGQAFDRGNMPKDPLSKMWIIYALIIGLVGAGVVCGTMASQMKSVKLQSGARNYVKAGSLNVVRSRDQFLYHHVERKAIPKSSSSGGGSSTHRSSSGRTHGGGGGKF